MRRRAMSGFFRCLRFLIAVQSMCAAQLAMGAAADDPAKEEPRAEVAPAAPEELKWKLPKGATAKAGSGEALLVRAAGGTEAVSQLYCDIGPSRVVMTSTGKLSL